VRQCITNQILLLESGDDAPWWRANNYKIKYVYSGSLRNSTQLPDDLITHVDSHMADYRAGSVVDSLYAEYVKDNEAGILNAIMEDERAYLIIKKTLLSELTKLFLSLILVENFINKYNVSETIDFIPREFSYTLYKLISKKRMVCCLKTSTYPNGM